MLGSADLVTGAVVMARGVTVPGKVHNLISPYENPNQATFDKVHDTISKALAEGEARTKLRGAQRR